MNRFVFNVPRTTIAIAAIAMTVLTLGAGVAPARLEAGVQPAYAAAPQSGAIEVTINPSRIDVVAAREPQTLLGAVRQIFTRKGQPS
jgi:hypothetical protein